jgi:hypothetical protein
MSAGDILGLPIPDAGPWFAAALSVHVICGVAAVISGAVAATAKKRPGRHPRTGHFYLWALGGTFATATVMAGIRWREDAHLFVIAVIAVSLGAYGYRARRLHRSGWPARHGAGMGARTSPCSPASTSTTDPPCRSGARCRTSPTGYFPASSAYRSSGAQFTASIESPGRDDQANHLSRITTPAEPPHRRPRKGAVCAVWSGRSQCGGHRLQHRVINAFDHAAGEQP